MFIFVYIYSILILARNQPFGRNLWDFFSAIKKRAKANYA